MSGEMNVTSRTFPNTLSVPFSPPVKAAEHAVIALLKRWPITGDEARNMVRVEITREVECELRQRVSATHYNLIHDPRMQIGPIKILGVSYYVVDNLPEPGWRVLP